MIFQIWQRSCKHLFLLRSFQPGFYPNGAFSDYFFYLRPQADDWLCSHIFQSVDVCLGHWGEERCRAVDWSPPGGEWGRLPVRPGKPKCVVMVNCEWLTEAPVHESFNSHLQKSFSLTPLEVRDMESECAMFKTPTAVSGSCQRL